MIENLFLILTLCLIFGMAKWCDEGETDVGAVYLKQSSRAAGLYLGLYLDTSEPGETATLASITEISGNGYARIQLLDADWTEQATKGEYKNLEKTFTASGGNWGDVYGYFICDVASGTSGNLLAVENFSDGPYTVNDGWSVKVTATVTAS